jgi:hypothetical protein
MADFRKEQFDEFLGVVRKYMVMRGNMNQKDLAEMTDTGVSTMSRFLNQKTTDFNPQLIARIVAKLNIPLHEVIDFVEEEYADKFIRLVKFFKEEKVPDEGTQGGGAGVIPPAPGAEGTAKQTITANISLGGKKVSIPFEAQGQMSPTDRQFLERLYELTPSQRAYVTEFLNLDINSRDLIVDLGNTLFRFFRQRGIEI